MPTQLSEEERKDTIIGSIMSEEGVGIVGYAQHLHSAAANGDVSGIENALKGTPNVNERNNKGWTALMFAARNGHVDAAKLLVKHGADVTAINAIGQTASDIAEFWQHNDLAACLRGSQTQSLDDDAGQQAQPVRNHFCNSPLNRISERRRDTQWLTELGSSANAVYILFVDLQALGCGSSNSLKRFPYSTSIQKLIDSKAPCIFLGIERSDADQGLNTLNVDSNETNSAESKTFNPQVIDSNVAVGWFTIDATNADDELKNEISSNASPISIPIGLMQMSRSEAAIVGLARSMLAWHDRYRFCPTCGQPTEQQEAGYKRQCVDKECRSNKGVHNTCYPRTDPTVIMAILSPDRKQVLLGRSGRFPSGMWSCLAGFMEPGESVEEACRREVFEESGITVGKVEYHSSQPWPMPSSLMIGCIGYALNATIKVDKEELEDARWFHVQDLRQMLSHQHPQKLFCPPEQAIAHQLIKHCVVNMSKL